MQNKSNEQENCQQAATSWDHRHEQTAFGQLIYRVLHHYTSLVLKRSWMYTIYYIQDEIHDNLKISWHTKSQIEAMKLLAGTQDTAQQHGELTCLACFKKHCSCHIGQFGKSPWHYESTEHGSPRYWMFLKPPSIKEMQGLSGKSHFPHFF